MSALTPDASDRRYYRVAPAGDRPVVLAVHATPFTAGALPFTTVAALLAAMPLPVPRVRHEFSDLGVLVLDDLGDVTLQARLNDVPEGERQRLYERAVDHLGVLQRRGAELADPRLLPYTLAFDVEKLTWEMDFFITHFIEGFRATTLPGAVRSALRTELTAVCERLSSERRVLCHRDYHSRNLMAVDDELFLIDFQDARLGPDTYDLVSLLRDSYVDLPPALVDHLTTRFRLGLPQPVDPDAFAARFDLMAVQRNLKALGTFGYQAVARANPAFAQYVPRTLAYVGRTFRRSSRFDRLRDVLTPLLPELA